MRLRDATERVARIVQELEGLEELPGADYNVVIESGLDSLGRMEFQQKVEDEFGIRFAPSEIAKMQTVGDFASVATGWYY